jgi:putative transposase
MKTSPEPRGWHFRGYLPHFDDGRSMQAITYRLGDSLPAHVLAQLGEQTLDDAKRRAAIEHYLDAGHGFCILREPANAQVVIETWMHSEGRDYHLHAWVVMPNHVHLLVEPLAGNGIGQIVGAWKSISARKILRATASAAGGPAPGKRHVWQLDYYDRFIRNENHYRAAVDYIHENPVKAGLVRNAGQWPWSSAAEWLRRTSGSTEA